ncbi:hypothetical protein DM45_3320 [Burkholderia mallei]|nr:hypothetical protein DM45_3320 [Burkholderia mallei]
MRPRVRRAWAVQWRASARRRIAASADSMAEFASNRLARMACATHARGARPAARVLVPHACAPRPHPARSPPAVLRLRPSPGTRPPPSAPRPAHRSASIAPRIAVASAGASHRARASHIATSDTLPLSRS